MIIKYNKTENKMFLGFTRNWDFDYIKVVTKNENNEFEIYTYPLYKCNGAYWYVETPLTEPLLNRKYMKLSLNDNDLLRDVFIEPYIKRTVINQKLILFNEGSYDDLKFSHMEDYYSRDFDDDTPDKTAFIGVSQYCEGYSKFHDFINFHFDQGFTVKHMEFNSNVNTLYFINDKNERIGVEGRKVEFDIDLFDGQEVILKTERYWSIYDIAFFKIINSGYLWIGIEFFNQCVKMQPFDMETRYYDIYAADYVTYTANILPLDNESLFNLLNKVSSEMEIEHSGWSNEINTFKLGDKEYKSVWDFDLYWERKGFNPDHQTIYQSYYEKKENLKNNR